jgi:Mg/Co/Ni transporter MgtE
MNLVGGLLLILFLLGNMAAGMTTLYFHASVISILTNRHPELWRDMAGYSMAARQAFGRFLYSRAALQTNDPDLSRAVIRTWISTGFWLAVLITSVVTAAVLDPTTR